MVNKPTKESIIEILNNVPLDDTTLEQVHNIIKIDPIHVGLMSEHLQKLEFSEHATLARSLCERDHRGVVATLIRRTIEEKNLPRQKKFDLASLCQSKGIAVSIDLLKYILHFVPTSTVPVGKGEALIRILMKGTPIETGDLGASGKKFEVKFNKSRIRGMHGFDLTNASQVAVALDEYFIYECDKLKFDARPLIGNEPNRWNFVSGKRKKFYLLSEIVRQSGMDPKYACSIFVNAYSLYYSQMKRSEHLNLSLSLAEEFNSDGTLKEEYGYSNFIYKMCAFSLKYYATVEGFDGMIILNSELECMYITKEFIFETSLEELSSFIKENLKVAPPSLTPLAGTQGSSFGISL